MAIDAPQHFSVAGLEWSVRGQPGQRRTTIELLQRGAFAGCLRRNPSLRDLAARALVEELRARVPVDTGMLKHSIRIEPIGRVAVSLGPDPYDRTRLKAALAGRVVKRRKRGRPRLSKFYALWANRTSRRPEYIEMSIRAASQPIAKACREWDQAQKGFNDVTALLTRRMA